VAAAANLTFAVKALNTEFARLNPDVAVTAALGASGTLCAQITHGAPFDVFLSADTEYPKKLIAAHHADPASFRVFATGKLVLWTTRDDLALDSIDQALRAPVVRRVAIAQPATAPYGRAAELALRSLGLWGSAAPKLVIGENIAQTAQFVQTGNADVGFVALSFVTSAPLAQRGRFVEVPPNLYAGASLEHAGVLTAHAAGNDAARRYLDFLMSDSARRILVNEGYRIPAAP
jgi:molybdate transport system substrate-binding protein